jgi:hypothetical protein
MLNMRPLILAATLLTAAPALAQQPPKAVLVDRNVVGMIDEYLRRGVGPLGQELAGALESCVLAQEPASPQTTQAQHNCPAVTEALAAQAKALTDAGKPAAKAPKP